MDVDVARIRDQVFFEGPERGRRLSRFWTLLLLAAVIASAGVVSNSTATVIGAMIVAPLMTPILGTVVAVVLADAPNLWRCGLLVVAGAATVVALSWLLGHLVPFPVVSATNSQVAQRVSPTLVDLIAALATGAVGAVALARSDISDTLPGVAIAISLVPPLCVVGLTLESGAPHESVGALLLFVTNVAAILSSGIVVLGLYRVSRLVAVTDFRRGGAVTLIGMLLVLVVIPLAINSRRTDATTVRQQDVQAVAQHWADKAGWAVVAVSASGNQILIRATGPDPAPDTATLRQDLDDAGLSSVSARVSLAPATYQAVPAAG
jgi:uncharacterized hydrophobic protein (TIGR00271 family)